MRKSSLLTMWLLFPSSTFLGGLRSGLTYGGARNIKELQRKAEFVEVSRNYIQESQSIIK